MRAAVYHGPRDLRVEDRLVPAIGPDEALLRVVGCGVCGTDHRIFSGGHRYYPPGTVRVPGHEVVGEIVDVGDAIKETLPTGLVFVAPNFGCGQCKQCIAGHNNRCTAFQAVGITMDGGFAEYVRIPAAAIAQGNVIPLAAGIDAAAATVIEPFACVVRGQDPLDIATGDAVLVIGGGPIGILHVMLARLKGAARVMIADRWPDRLATARAQGADVTIDVRNADLAVVAMEETGMHGADAVVIAAPSHEAMTIALKIAATGGRISYFAGLPKDRPQVEIDANLIHYKELRITGSSACSTRDCHRAAAIVNSGRLDFGALVTRRLPLADALNDFGAAKERRSIKTVLSPAMP